MVAKATAPRRENVPMAHSFLFHESKTDYEVKKTKKHFTAKLKNKKVCANYIKINTGDVRKNQERGTKNRKKEANFTPFEAQSRMKSRKKNERRGERNA